MVYTSTKTPESRSFFSCNFLKNKYSKAIEKLEMQFFSFISLAMFDSVEWLILTLLSLLLIVIFWWAIYGFFKSIYVFIFSWAEDDKRQEARNGIRYMILGIFFTLMFLFIFPVIFRKFGLPNHEKYTAQNILQHTSKLLGSILSFWKEVATNWNGFTTSPSPSNGNNTNTPPAEL